MRSGRGFWAGLLLFATVLLLVNIAGVVGVPSWVTNVCNTTQWATPPVLGTGTTIGCYGIIGSGLTVASNTTILDSFVIGNDVTIGKDVWIGAGSVIGSNAVILDSVTLANDSLVSAGTILGPASNTTVEASSSPDSTNLRDWLPVVLVYIFWLGLMFVLAASGLGWQGFKWLGKRREGRGRKEEA